jgi:hypothetical protein
MQTSMSGPLILDVSNMGQLKIKPALMIHSTGYDPASGYNGNIYKSGIRDWSWDNKGKSLPGSYYATTYGLPLYNYFVQKPYINKSPGYGRIGSAELVEDQNDNGVANFPSSKCPLSRYRNGTVIKARS